LEGNKKMRLRAFFYIAGCGRGRRGRGAGLSPPNMSAFVMHGLSPKRAFIISSLPGSFIFARSRQPSAVNAGSIWPPNFLRHGFLHIAQHTAAPIMTPRTNVPIFFQQRQPQPQHLQSAPHAHSAAAGFALTARTAFFLVFFIAISNPFVWVPPDYTR
jgi:hypothetical protein